jgi:chromosome segregation ATPase
MEQNEQLTTWASQRDAILLEISNLRTEGERLIASNKNLADSNTEIQKAVAISIGRMNELDKQERDYENICSNEIMNLSIKKTRLEGEVTSLTNKVSLLESEKKSLIETINFLKSVHEIIFARTGSLDKVIDHVTRVSEQNSNDISLLTSKLKETMKDLIDINNKNVAETNIIIEKLPKVFFDVQRKSLIRERI